MMAQELADHKVLSCPNFLRTCPLGCGAKCRTVDLPRHQSHDCPKRHTAGGFIACPLGCGRELSAFEQFDHVTRECLRRIVDCSWSCGEVKLSFVAVVVVVCVM